MSLILLAHSLLREQKQHEGPGLAAAASRPTPATGERAPPSVGSVEGTGANSLGRGRLASPPSPSPNAALAFIAFPVRSPWMCRSSSMACSRMDSASRASLRKGGRGGQAMDPPRQLAEMSGGVGGGQRTSDALQAPWQQRHHVSCMEGFRLRRGMRSSSPTCRPRLSARRLAGRCAWTPPGSQPWGGGQAGSSLRALHNLGNPRHDLGLP